MHVSKEAPEETRERLLRVLARAEFVSHPGRYVFEEHAADGFPPASLARCLAAVRDGDAWSTLVAAGGHGVGEEFGLFSFHFEAGVDNSGFVGWLASELKERLGTGVFVVCGRNSARGGIFDYWGVPAAVHDAARAVIEEMRGAGSA
jgi:hypothetical protein